ncbi:uncharacterized protein An17g01690 [Aspergillus niger]|uniref:Contig An17c0070, genomic contig n=2 Tax=Aspergillus niger TaxID=5061 RepID=A2R9J9_ASPNC|nr:uncharacterized protein An17g01690 [Aspergillus niger]CAK43065.1 unnamed protein product [Aspergillus niger]
MEVWKDDGWMGMSQISARQASTLQMIGRERERELVGKRRKLEDKNDDDSVVLAQTLRAKSLVVSEPKDSDTTGREACMHTYFARAVQSDWFSVGSCLDPDGGPEGTLHSNGGGIEYEE